jgi:hypothetical protein
MKHNTDSFSYSPLSDASGYDRSRTACERMSGPDIANLPAIVGEPQVESIGSGMTTRDCREPIAAGPEDRADLVVGCEKSLRLPW